MLGKQLAVAAFWVWLFHFLISVESAKILMVFPFEAPSQCVFLTPYIRALADRGHNLTVIHSYPQCDAVQHVHYIDIPDAYNATAEFFIQDLTPTASRWNGIYTYRNLLIRISLNILKNDEVHQLMHSNASYDLVVLEPSCTYALFGIAAHFNASLMGLATCGSDWVFDELVGYTVNSIFEPMLPVGFTRGGTMLQKLYNWAHISEEWLMMNLLFWPQLRQIFEQFFPHLKQSFNEILQSFSLILLNQHFSLCRARPNVPGLVDVAGLHVPQQTPKLPADLEQFIEQAQHGVIYFCLGWEVQSKDLPAVTTALLLDVFKTLPQRIIWKYAGKPLANLSSNIYISHWLPQQAILAHPNVKIFATHGGSLSVIEAVYYAKPVLGLPLFYNQFRNLDCLVEANVGLSVDLMTLTKPTLVSALQQLLMEPLYAQNALAVSKRFRDRQNHPLDTAVYWTEYIMRYNGAPHMRVPASSIKFLDYYSIDKVVMVVGRLVLILSFVIFVLYKIKAFLIVKRRLLGH